MAKALEFLFIISLLICSFFLGAKYSEEAQQYASWMFEERVNEIELPDLNDTQNPEIEAKKIEKRNIEKRPSVFVDDSHQDSLVKPNSEDEISLDSAGGDATNQPMPEDKNILPDLSL